MVIENRRGKGVTCKTEFGKVCVNNGISGARGNSNFKHYLFGLNVHCCNIAIKQLLVLNMELLVYAVLYFMRVIING